MLLSQPEVTKGSKVVNLHQIRALEAGDHSKGSLGEMRTHLIKPQVMR